jgi:hypothetical protein
VSRADYWPFAVAIRDARRAWFLRTTKRDAAEVAAQARRLRGELESGPRWRSELSDGSVVSTGAGLFLDVVRATPSGTWERRRADRYALAEQWVGPEEAHPDPLGLLIARYVGAFGPATAKDVSSFTSVPVNDLRETLERVAPRRFRDEGGALLYDVPRSPLPSEDAVAPVRFLPTWDATLLVHCRRARILSEEHRPKVFSTRTPQSFPTFLVDGSVAGTWRHERGRIELDPFERLSRGVRAELEDEAERLALLHA